MQTKINKFRQYYYISKPSDKAIRNIVRNYSNSNEIIIYLNDIFDFLNNEQQLEEWFILLFSNILVKNNLYQINLNYVRQILKSNYISDEKTIFLLLFSIAKDLNSSEFSILLKTSNSTTVSPKGIRSFVRSFRENKNLLEIKNYYLQLKSNSYINNWLTIEIKKIFNQMEQNITIHRLKGYKCLKQLLNNNYELSSNSFQILLNSLEMDDRTKKTWKDSYYHLTRFWNDTENIFKIKNSINKDNFKQTNIIDKILVSGMGWSGSGALHDFFKEYNSITESNSEFQHIQGKHGLHRLLSTLNNFKSFREALLHFFWYSVFGHIISPSYNEHKSSKYAERYVYGKNPYQYSLAMNKFLKNIILFYFCLDSDLFKKIANQFIDDMISVDVNKNTKYILLDNVIGVSNIEILDILNNYKIFVTFRDPRSNYLALKNENFRFNPNVEDFIQNYRKKRLDFIENCHKINTTNLIEVQFEKFVLNEEYRESLLQNLPKLSNNETRHKESIFKPFESKKNVLLYKDLKDSQEIIKIQNELKEFCFDI